MNVARPIQTRARFARWTCHLMSSADGSLTVCLQYRGEIWRICPLIKWRSRAQSIFRLALQQLCGAFWPSIDREANMSLLPRLYNTSCMVALEFIRDVFRNAGGTTASLYPSCLHTTRKQQFCVWKLDGVKFQLTNSLHFACSSQTRSW